MADIAVAGLAELRKTLLTLPTKIQRRALNKAMAAGARVVAAQAKQTAPVRSTGKRSGGVITAPGALKRNIVSKKGARKYEMGADSRFIIGVRHGRINTNAKTVSGRKGKVTAYDKRGQDPFYFRFQELGFTAVGRRKQATAGEKHRRKFNKATYGKRIPGKHFLERALETSASTATEKVRSTLAAEIQKAL